MDFLGWFNRNKCTIYKVGIAVLLTLVLVGIFAGTAATGGAAGAGLAGLLAAKFGLGAAVAAALARLLLALVAAGIAASGIGDWIVCTLFNIPECCDPTISFWIAYGEFVQQNSGSGSMNSTQCEELRRVYEGLSGLSSEQKAAIEAFLEEHCGEEEE